MDSWARCVLSDDALQVLFAPYCGGLARSDALRDALKLLQGRRLEGSRPVAGAGGHEFVLSWSDERAPMDVGTKPDLPDAFWSWVLVEQNDAVADA